jgi:hypothetical protein
MKTQKQITILAVALAGVALMETGAHAQTTVAGAQGDLILGFRDPSGTVNNNLMVDLGAPANFVSFASTDPGSTVSLAYGSFGAGYSSFFGSNQNVGLSVNDLITAYGSSWATQSNTLSWSVFGYGSSSTLYGSFSGTVANRGSTSTQNGIISKLQTEDSSFLGSTTTMQSPEANNLTDPYSIALSNGNPGTYSKNYNSLSQSTETVVPISGTDTAQLWIVPTNAGGGAPPAADDIGTLTFGSNGNLTFTAAGSVPEPSTVGLLGLAGAGWLGMLRRRRSVA